VVASAPTGTGLSDDLVRMAHADGWQAVASGWPAPGGDTAVLAGVRLMATGLPSARWNNGDVHDPAAVEIDAVRGWYAERGLPWGLRLPAGTDWRYGQRLLTLRLMGLNVAQLRPVGPPAGVTVRAAGPDDGEAVEAVDAAAFGPSDEPGRRWLHGVLTHPAMVVCVAESAGAVVGTGHCVLSDGGAGPAVYVAGIGVLPEHRRRGIGAAVSSALVVAGRARGARLAQLHPDTEHAAAIYRRLGFVEFGGLDVWIGAGDG
jgi:ribosomal protein S18 acetylase RimI-like enzyme